MLISIFISMFISDRIDSNDENESKQKSHNNIMNILLSTAAVVTFILTENVMCPMVLVDSWTILMAVICGTSVIFRALPFLKKKFE